MMPDFRLLVVGRYLPGDVSISWVPSTRVVLPSVEAEIDRAWLVAMTTPGVRLFDGPVARLESFAASSIDGKGLSLVLSATSYRVVVGTNFANPQLASAFGPDVMANPLGVSTGVLTADGYWVMGRRNRSVAYYPSRVHPFAGSLEVRELADIFDDVRRELHEELAIDASSIAQIICLGLACDVTLLHPESIFLTQTLLTRDQIIAQLDRDEHDAVWSIPAAPEATSAALRQADLTPVARAVLLLNGRTQFGDAWFAAAADTLGLDRNP